MATILRSPIEIRPDVVHVYTRVYNIITRYVPMKQRQNTVVIMGEDFDTVPIPEPVPQPGGLDAMFSSAGATIRDPDFRDLLTAPFFLFEGTGFRTTVYSELVRRTLSGDGVMTISKYTTLEHPEITGDGEITDIEVK